eukprot:3177562-Amphidinium_carterae.2
MPKTKSKGKRQNKRAASSVLRKPATAGLSGDVTHSASASADVDGGSPPADEVKDGPANVEDMLGYAAACAEAVARASDGSTILARFLHSCSFQEGSIWGLSPLFKAPHCAQMVS